MTHTLFARAESVEKDGLFESGSPLQLFTVGELTLGYIYDLAPMGHLQCGLGASGTANFIPDALISSYGNKPL